MGLTESSWNIFPFEWSPIFSEKMKNIIFDIIFHFTLGATWNLKSRKSLRYIDSNKNLLKVKDFYGFDSVYQKQYSLNLVSKQHKGGHIKRVKYSIKLFVL